MYVFLVGTTSISILVACFALTCTGYVACFPLYVTVNVCIPNLVLSNPLTISSVNVTISVDVSLYVTFIFPPVTSN